jgi:hypothetical protein
MANRKRVIAYAILIILIVSLNDTSAIYAEKDELRLENGSLVIGAFRNHFALLVNPLEIESGYNELSAEIKIRGANGITYVPGIHFYWNRSAWTGTRFYEGDFYVIEGYIESGGTVQWIRYRDPSLTMIGSWSAKPAPDAWKSPDANEWNRFKVVLTPIDVKYYAAYQDEEWMFLGSTPRPFQDGEPWIILGKGFSSPGSSFPNPYFANSKEPPGPYTVTYIDYIKVEMDGKVIFYDNFEEDELKDDWVEIVYGDENLSEIFKKLDIISQRASYQKKILGYPNPFSDGDEIRLAYFAKEKCNVQLLIYNEKAANILILEDKLVTKGYNEIVWDGKDRNGEPVQSGIYLAIILAITEGELYEIGETLLVKVK